MSAKILNFPSDKKLSNDKSFFNSNSTAENVSEYGLHIISNNEYMGFENSLLEREPINEMFTPDYFMLVE